MTWKPTVIYDVPSKAKLTPQAKAVDVFPGLNHDPGTAHYPTIVKMLSADDSKFTVQFCKLNGTTPVLYEDKDFDFPRSGRDVISGKEVATHFGGLPSTVEIWITNKCPSETPFCLLLVDREYLKAKHGLDPKLFAIPEGKWPISLSSELDTVAIAAGNIVKRHDNDSTRLPGEDADIEVLRRFVKRMA